MEIIEGYEHFASGMDYDFIPEILEEHDERLYQESKREGFCLTRTGVPQPDHEGCNEPDSCEDTYLRQAQIRAFLKEGAEAALIAEQGS